MHMEKKTKADWVNEIFSPLTVVVTFIVICLIAYKPPNVSEWKE